jgi:thioredoxin
MIKVGAIILAAVIGIYFLFRGGNKENSNKQIKEKKVMELTKKDFLEKVVNYEQNPNEWNFLGDKPTIIDFYASWCGPCKAFAPVLEEVAEEYKGVIDVYKVNTENEEELAAVFNIRSIPTILFIPVNGQPQIVTGAMPKPQLIEAIEHVLLQK